MFVVAFALFLFVLVLECFWYSFCFGGLFCSYLFRLFVLVCFLIVFVFFCFSCVFVCFCFVRCVCCSGRGVVLVLLYLVVLFVFLFACVIICLCVLLSALIKSLSSDYSNVFMV